MNLSAITRDLISLRVWSRITNQLRRLDRTIYNNYRLLEFRTTDPGLLPEPPTANEKYLYSSRGMKFILPLSIISFSCITLSTTSFLLHQPALWGLYIVLSVNAIYFLASLMVNSFTKGFDVASHKRIVAGWRPGDYPSVDVFLPTAGESINVLTNTWRGVTEMVCNYPGVVTVYCLDDADRAEVGVLASQFKFDYRVRENRGWYKKAGNLRHGFEISSGEFIVIFDADFVPRRDFLAEMLPYFFQNETLAIVQSPQYFAVSAAQNWLERGAGAVQELFYRFSQVSRQHHDASICVGSNAIYRRLALQDTGGTALIEHSEDVHTGFNLRLEGWTIQYIPIILAKGLCPADMQSFFKQQYRWCLGSMSLMNSKKFWSAKLSFRTRLSYLSGFMYYAHTGLGVVCTPFIPIILLISFPDRVSITNYALIFPAFVFTQLVIPFWHKATYGIESWAVKSIYGWAHLFAISDSIINKPMSWQPTGAKSSKDRRYTTFRCLQVVFNFIPGLIWTSLAAYDMATISYLNFLPLFISGVYYLLICAKISFYGNKVMNLSLLRRRSNFGYRSGSQWPNN